MTRDGFIELRLKHTGAFTKAAMPAEILREMIANEVDFYIAAGMLKLDEPKPKTIYGKINDAMARVTSLTAPADVRRAFEAVGLKIVEK